MRMYYYWIKGKQTQPGMLINYLIISLGIASLSSSGFIFRNMLSLCDVSEDLGDFPHIFTCEINLPNINNLFKSKKPVRASRQIIQIIVKLKKKNVMLILAGLNQQE